MKKRQSHFPLPIALNESYQDAPLDWLRVQPLSADPSDLEPAERVLKEEGEGAVVAVLAATGHAGLHSAAGGDGGVVERPQLAE